MRLRRGECPFRSGRNGDSVEPPRRRPGRFAFVDARSYRACPHWVAVVHPVRSVTRVAVLHPLSAGTIRMSVAVMKNATARSDLSRVRHFHLTSAGRWRRPRFPGNSVGGPDRGLNEPRATYPDETSGRDGQPPPTADHGGIGHESYQFECPVHDRAARQLEQPARSLEHA